MSEELAIKIFKQFDFEIEMCEKCHRKKEKERICIGCLDKAKESLLNYIEQLQQENNILIEFEKWLNLEIKRYNELIYPKQGIKPYGEELYLLESYRSSYMYCLEKLQELKEGKNEK